MEQKSLWKKILLLTIGSAFAFQVSVVRAQDSTSSSSSEEDKTEGCVLTEQ